MHDALHAQKMGFASTFSLPILEDEINHFVLIRLSSKALPLVSRSGERLIVELMQETEWRGLHLPKPQCAPGTSIPIGEWVQRLVINMSLPRVIGVRAIDYARYQGIQCRSDFGAPARRYMVPNTHVEAILIAKPVAGRDDANKRLKVLGFEERQIYEGGVCVNFGNGRLPKDALNAVAFSDKIFKRQHLVGLRSFGCQPDKHGWFHHKASIRRTERNR